MRLIDADLLISNIVIENPDDLTPRDIYKIEQIKKWINSQPAIDITAMVQEVDSIPTKGWTNAQFGWGYQEGVKTVQTVVHKYTD